MLVVTDGLDDTSKFQQAVKKGLPCITLSGMLAAISATPVAMATRKRGREVPESTRGVKLCDEFDDEDDENDMGEQNGLGNNRNNNNTNGKTKATVSKNSTF